MKRTIGYAYLREQFLGVSSLLLVITMLLLMQLVLAKHFSFNRNGLDQEVRKSVENSRITNLRGTKENRHEAKNPLIILGGFGGSALMSRRTHAREPHFWCSATTEKPFQVWASVKELIPYISEECAVHDLRLELRGNPPRMHPLDPGVSITGKDIGGLSGVNYITDTHLVKNGEYMFNLTTYLIKNGGYVPGKSLRAMTYDWRVGPMEWRSSRANNTGGDWDLFKKLIEETFEMNNRTRVTLLGHSFGGPFVQLFLATYVSTAWKRHYIKQFISVAGNYDGGVESPILQAIGADYGFSFLSSAFKEVARSFGSLSVMYPLQFPFKYPIFIYHNNQTGEHIEYNADLNGYKRYLADSGMSTGWNVFMHEYSGILDVKRNAPEVPLHCLIGKGIPTVTQFTYVGSKRMPDLLPGDIKTSRHEDGDGTVLDYSLKMCTEFKQKEPINTVVFPHSRHNDIMKDVRIFSKILEIVQ